ncbi:AAA family ATPase [Flavobacterium ginsengiterrae]|uniref:ATPase AAA-type core domain-containing protein n=1 Tax=Flavobacterium ginsengiterrae TaxID=871695 RepID=A0ABP7H6S1_9FLAO
MDFRINEIQIDVDNYQTDRIKLVNHSNDKRPNHFSLIIGNNGTGKSRLLGNIARVLNKRFQKSSNELFDFSLFEISKEPSKIIAVSNSLSDKFPIDRSFRSRHDEDFSYNKERYNYLGTRGGMGSSSKYLMRRAIDILLENYSNKNVSKCYRHVFDYLDYSPVIKLEYRIRHAEIVHSNELITPEHLRDYLHRKSSYSVFDSKYYSRIENHYKTKFQDICDFLNKLRQEQIRTYELTINFSSNNIERIDKDDSSYKEDLRLYEILNALRKLNMITGFEVKLFKKDNQGFSFSDASSGESNILTTLIALVPLVEDRCCVLIDEPEISLHPSWQYRYLELLNKIFENFDGCHIIIASHSHFIVSDLPKDNSSVVTLKRNEKLIKSNLLLDSTFGCSAEDILLNVFEMPTTRNYYISNLVTESLELLGKNQKTSSRFKELKLKLQDVFPNIKDEDPLKLVISTILKVHI